MVCLCDQAISQSIETQFVQRFCTTADFLIANISGTDRAIDKRITAL